jgi:hypothetical protein
VIRDHEVLAGLNRQLETAIPRHPEQYFWMHRRRPKASYDAPSPSAPVSIANALAE